MAGSFPIDTVKRLLTEGKAYVITKWAQENGIDQIEKLIDAAGKELLKEQKK